MSETQSYMINTFYVANDGSDNTGDGSLNNPWATITKALDNVPDNSTILVRPGTYVGRVRIRGRFTQGVTVRSEIPYQAVMRANETVFTIFNAEGITLEGFDIAHSGSGASPLVVQIQTAEPPNITRRITLRNNILHDSFNNDILKVGNGAREIRIEGNMFFNQQGSDEHIDINSVENVVVQDNIFFNDFGSSGRINNNDTSSFIVIKDSNGSDDGILGSQKVQVRRNVFLNWEGSIGQSFLRLGEDGTINFEASDILVENNLMLGNAANLMRSDFTVQGGREIVFRHNTIVGDLPSLSFAMRLIALGSNSANENIQFYNNIWSDPTGTMGTEAFLDVDFAEAPVGQNTAVSLDNNLFWNGSSPIPPDIGQFITSTDDVNRIVDDPLLGSQVDLVVPHWDGNAFKDKSTTIREAFERLVTLYGTPAPGSAVIDTANPIYSPTDDIFGNNRNSEPDIGAIEVFTEI